jgi:hypothetical protein
MQKMFEEVEDPGGGKNPDKGKQICGGQHASAMLFFGTMLQQSADGNDKKTAKEAEESEQH